MSTKEQKFGTWSSGNVNVEKIILESQTNNPASKLRWVPYDNFYDTKHIADSKYYTLHSARLINYKRYKSDESWGVVTLKELKDYRHDILEFIKAVSSFILRL